MKKLVAYAQDFVSFLALNLTDKELQNVNNIILFGSAARDEASNDSDIDIFIDIAGKPFEKRVSRIIDDFYKSILFKKYWKLLGVENEIKCIVGRLEKWRDLKTSIIADGIILYGKYKAVTEGKLAVVFYWNKVSSESKRVLLSKKIYGYAYKGKKYKGLLEIYSGKKLSTNCILVKLEHAKTFLKTFRELKIPVKMLHISIS